MNKFIPIEEILPGQIWESCDGNKIIVKIIRVENREVYYKSEICGGIAYYNKGGWQFQVRYYLKEE